MKKIFIWILVVTFAVSILMVGVSCKKTVETTTTAAPETKAAAETTAAPETTVAAETTTAYNPADKVIYYVGVNLGHPVIRTWLSGIFTKGDELGYSIKVAGPLNRDFPAGAAALEQIVAQKVDGILSVINVPDYFPAAEKAAEKGIPIGVVHSINFIQANEPKGVTFAVGPDQEKMGPVCADILAGKINKKGTIGIAVSDFTNPDETNLADVFEKYIKSNYPDIKLLDRIEIGTEGASTEAVSKISAYIKANPDMNAAFTTTGAAAEAWAAAFEGTGKAWDDIYLMGMDYTKVNLDLIQSNKIFGVMGQPLYEEGQEDMVLLDKVLRGEKVEYLNFLPAIPITHDDPAAISKYLEIVSKVEEVVNAHWSQSK